jgi:dTDP-4-dehydrorhamnose 3,5-epimerase
VVTLEASDDEPVLFWAPASFARGFCALEDVTEIEYFCTNQYNAACETGIRWDDPSLGIAWPAVTPLLSPKDAAAGTLADWLARPEAEAFRYVPPGA